MPDIQTSTISSVLVYSQFVGDGSRLTGIPAAGGVATTLLNMGENNICNCSSVYADSFYGGTFYGNGAYLTSVPGSWVGTATSDLDMSGYTLSNSSGILNLAGTSGIQILDTTTTCNVQITISTNTMKIIAPTSNLILNLGGYTGTLSIDGSGNLLWNGDTVNVTAPPPQE